MSTRTSQTDSLWLATAPATAYPALVEDLTFDVAVIGGGIAGVSAALALKRDGARVAVLERGVICGGATGFTTAKVSALQETKYTDIHKLHGDSGARAYAAASLAAVAQIDTLIRDMQIDCSWERVPAYTYAADPSQADVVSKEAAIARAAGLDAQLTTDTPLPFDVPVAVCLENQGQLDAVVVATELPAA